MEKKVDRRIKKTQKLIKDNFVELLLVKPIQEIHVQTLAEMADINRGTFYQHYDDIYDLLNSIEDEIIAEFTSALQEVTPDIPANSLSINEVEKTMMMLLDRILVYVKENEKLIVALFRDEHNTKIKQKLRDFLYDYFLQNYKNTNESEILRKKFDYYYGFVTSGSVEVITTWIKSGLKDDTKELGELLEQFILNGAQMFLNIN